MYLSHYGLAEPPFAITPDPRFVFLSERHRDALAHLLYGIGQGGFIETFDSSATPPALPGNWAKVDVSGTSGYSGGGASTSARRR